MKLINPAANPALPIPDHAKCTAQEIAGEMAGAKTCIVKIGTAQPGGSLVMHVHPHQEEVFYILEGELTMTDKDQNKITARAGQALFIPAGDGHSAFNHGAVKAVYLAVKSPAQ